jgi:predicted N-acetyltransferase YhbS
MSDFQIRLLNGDEQRMILPLLGVCFPDYWEQLAVKNNKMPFEEISFAAFDGEKVVGHCGIIPYQIWCGGKLYPMAGVASVATHPDYRRRGIAAGLCKFAAEWAAEKGFASLPLYTGFFQVYEKQQWQTLQLPPVYRIADGKRTAAISWCRGSDLSEAEKKNIAALYEKSEMFNGKVVRSAAGTLHSWERMFNDPDLRFAAVPKMYAIKVDDVVVELNFSAENTTLADRRRLFYQLGAQNVYLPPTEMNAELFAGVELLISDADPMHGELPMVRDIVEKFHSVNQIYFPAADKF